MQKSLRVLIFEGPVRKMEMVAEELRGLGTTCIRKEAPNFAEFAVAFKEFKPDIVLASHDTSTRCVKNTLDFLRERGREQSFVVLRHPDDNSLDLGVLSGSCVDFAAPDNASRLAATIIRVVRENEERAQRRKAETLLELKYQEQLLQTEALRQSEERFRQLADSVREVFWMTDLKRRQVLYVSPAYEEVWGRTLASYYAAPQDWLEAVYEEDRERVMQAAFNAAEPYSYDLEYRIRRPDGSLRWIHDRAFPVRDENGEIYRIAGVAEDVSHRKHLERAVLEISDREQERIGRDLHDGLCQLLVSVGFNANLLKQDLVAGSSAEASAVERICAKIKEAIRMARGISHGLCPLDFRDEDLAAGLKNLARTTREDFKIDCDAKCDAVASVKDSATAGHLYRIAREAVCNAVKHGNPSRISIRLTLERGQPYLTVADNGCGIGDRPTAGPGIGLQIMRYRASMIGGALEIRHAFEEQRRGTIVSCAFPRDVCQPHMPDGL